MMVAGPLEVVVEMERSGWVGNMFWVQSTELANEFKGMWWRDCGRDGKTG